MVFRVCSKQSNNLNNQELSYSEWHKVGIPKISNDYGIELSLSGITQFIHALKWPAYGDITKPLNNGKTQDTSTDLFTSTWPPPCQVRKNDHISGWMSHQNRAWCILACWIDPFDVVSLRCCVKGFNKLNLTLHKEYIVVSPRLLQSKQKFFSSTLRLRY